MTFISFQYLFFFPLVVLFFFLSPQRFRWCILLLASCIFYMAFIPKYILVLLFTIIVDYCAAILIERSVNHVRKTWLIVSIIANTGVLAVFKYYNFFLDNLQLNSFLPALKIVLPIGLSFHTFQAMAYNIEVYRGNQKAERHFGIYALYIMFFPQLVAGPIERPQHVLPQFYEKKEFSYDAAVSGLRLILWGFFKKLVIADRLAGTVDIVYNSPGNYPSWVLLMATFFFAFQIYFDFSAYSDIARGSAGIMGFRLMQNFNFPYQSRSLAEFWTRWHISLSTWFRDYIYIPLGGNRTNLPAWCFNILFVFILSGLWHGANRTFIAWGFLNGVYILLEKITARARGRFGRWLQLDKLFFYPWLQTAIVFLLIMESWVFFRAKDISDALTIFYKQKSLIPDLFHINRHQNIQGITGMGQHLFFSFVLIAGLYIVEIMISRNIFRRFYLPSKRPFRWLAYYLLIVIIFLFGVFEKRDFIYFQF